MVPNPVHLQPLSSLHILHVSSACYWRMHRWHALDVLQKLPYCEVDSSGA